ncbi:LysR family transcriptional regulator [Robinsoniella peoriensis]|uniref:LysR family transcriptional regulator n=1 Tax=Robinsoniella peoriensis TaxID=180332 RepID=UPI00085BEC11|nr:LysR family transcriptional regulator [Robinsoniella peoriensis]
MFSSMKYIYEVYKEKSFSKAAKNLYISQPALSATVKRTEEQIGAPIFDRSSNPIRLTDCGEKYILAIEQILSIQNDFTNYVTDLNQLETGSLSIGGSNLFSSYVLPPLISEFSRLYPKIHVDLLEESTSRLEQQLLTGTLDLIIDNYVFDEAVFAKHLYQEEHLVLAVPKALSINQTLEDYQIDPAAIRDGRFLDTGFPSVPLISFQDEPFVFLKTENDTGERGLTICQNHGFKPNIILKLDQLMTAYNVTCSGMGISFISDTLVACVQPHPDVLYYKVDDSKIGRNIYFFRKQNKYMTRSMQEFLNLASRKSQL